uniref:Uncharacterized protein n=1 Tax=Kwoniella pini CBS 10737 TaxID=1296096 RepID=A0A1B9HU75_9TREE|nr:uncharacterized protein I206_07205 [Kwoniella pini CBS 10737]OCF46818.1 hypothetical protein I206_07205 [Kwoniella pini CBS 10737]
MQNTHSAGIPIIQVNSGYAPHQHNKYNPVPSARDASQTPSSDVADDAQSLHNIPWRGESSDRLMSSETLLYNTSAGYQSHDAVPSASNYLLRVPRCDESRMGYDGFSSVDEDDSSYSQSKKVGYVDCQPAIHQTSQVSPSEDPNSRRYDIKKRRRSKSRLPGSENKLETRKRLTSQQEDLHRKIEAQRTSLLNLIKEQPIEVQEQVTRAMTNVEVSTELMEMDEEPPGERKGKEFNKMENS